MREVRRPGLGSARRAVRNPFLFQGRKEASGYGSQQPPESADKHIICDASSAELFTSSFRLAGRHPKAVAIARGVPVWFRGRRYPALEPTAEMLRIRDAAAFTTAYLEQLSKLDVRAVAQDMGAGAVLLCWEPLGKFCHRELVAAWLREAGIEVREWQPAPAARDR